MSILLYNNLTITGDCSNTNSGAYTFEWGGGQSGYTVNFINPPSSPVYVGSATTYTQTGLSADTYVIQIIDSTMPENQKLLQSITISSGVCVSISDVVDSGCFISEVLVTDTSGNTNLVYVGAGVITATIPATYNSNSNFYLYETTQGYITSANTGLNSYSFNSLTAGTYYVIAEDGGGCSGMSESCIVKSSDTFTYNFYVVNNGSCAGSPSGAIYITDLNGVPPYTYSWQPGGQTTFSITGQPAGSYAVTVTDANGCSITKTTDILNVEPVGIVSTILTPPSCYSSDAQVTVTLSGGTPPYYFLGSNGESIIKVAQTHTFSGIPAGNFTITVTDAGFCTDSETVSVNNSNGFTFLSISSEPNFCANPNGSITVTLAGGVGNYLFILTDPNNGITQYPVSDSSTVVNYTMGGLSGGTYQVEISGGTCNYITSATVGTTTSFDLTYNITGTTCQDCVNNPIGAIEVIIVGGTSPYFVSLDGLPFPGIQINTSAYTFTNVCHGIRTVTVVDSNRCELSESVFVPTTPQVTGFLNYTQPSAYAFDGTISTFITNGTPPYTWTWSSNVNGQTGLFLTNLSAGTYTIDITDSIGCSTQLTQTLNAPNPKFISYLYNICEDVLINTGVLLKKGLKQMLNEGYYDLTNNDVNCILNSATFTTFVSVGGTVVSDSFYTSTNLNDYPTDEEFTQSIENLLLSFSGISQVNIVIEDNVINIKTQCNTLSGVEVKIDLKISYDINCEVINP